MEKEELILEKWGNRTTDNEYLEHIKKGIAYLELARPSSARYTAPEVNESYRAVAKAVIYNIEKFFELNKDSENK